MKTRTSLHHSPTRNSPCRTTSDILKHFQIFRDVAMNGRNVHKVHHHHLNVLYLTERCFSNINEVHVFFPKSFVYKIFSLLLFQIILRIKDGFRKLKYQSYLGSIFLDQMICHLAVFKITLRPQRGHHCISCKIAKK